MSNLFFKFLIDLRMKTRKGGFGNYLKERFVIYDFDNLV